jgi:hypothetical protein
VAAATGAGAVAVASLGMMAVGARQMARETPYIATSAVNDEIRHRQTILPAEVSGGDSIKLDLFFPLAPSPRHVEITYTAAEIEHRLEIDTQEALDGIHLE